MASAVAFENGGRSAGAGTGFDVQVFRSYLEALLLPGVFLLTSCSPIAQILRLKASVSIDIMADASCSHDRDPYRARGQSV